MPKSFSALLLDSGSGWLNNGDESYLIFNDPEFSIFSIDNELTVVSSTNKKTISGDPILELQKKLNEGYTALGYIGYEYSKYTNEKFKQIRKKDGEELPQTYFHFYKEDFIETGNISDLNFSNMLGENLALEERNKQVSNFNREDYISIVDKAKSYIGTGDIYQVNLSQRFKTSPIHNPLSAFLKFYSYQPVPYGAYIDFGDMKLISGSMELFLDNTDNKIITKPIKGTAKRDKNPRLDKKNKKELLESEKERAENLMIVDLMRNDLGRISKIGSVKVKNLFNINSYSTLYQMESEIEGVIKDNVDLKEIINSTFPPGSVTGAPKSRALEIIDELEPHYRGPYCGAIGVFYPNGNFKLSVAIRIMTVSKRGSNYWVGAGIVWDSLPEKEYLETLLKARAIQKSIFI